MADESKDLLQVPYDIIRHVDMTPDENLPIRIIEAYYQNCKVKFNLDNIDDDSKEVCKFLNESAEHGEKILEKVLEVLKANKDQWSEISKCAGIGQLLNGEGEGTIQGSD